MKMYLKINSNEYKERIYRLENQNKKYREKLADTDKMMSQIGEQLNFEDTESLAQVISDLKKQNDEKSSAILNVENQSDLILSKKVTVPIINAVKKEIVEYLDELY